ncbi:hypothetical protein ACIA5A_26580 [Micromonospora sp. NPDC051300]|uniref:hypothetical protein n=1 Tax=Micromonospora sp. NPDC051300 TaxID=3364286 RepID=UPI00378C3676
MDFDFGAHARAVTRVDDDGITYDGFRWRPLPDGALRCLRYFRRLCHPSQPLVAPAQADPIETAMLARWAHEKDWHGEMLTRVLAAHDVAPDDPEAAVARRRVRHGTPARWASVNGDDAVAIRMTWAAVDEWTIRSGYHRLTVREEHPVLTDVLHRVTRRESRHAAYLASQARDRLARSVRARRLTRLALRHLWAPGASGALSRTDTDHLVRYLFGDEAGWQEIRHLDDRIDRLPGLAGLGLVSRAVRRHGVVDPSTRRG